MIKGIYSDIVATRFSAKGRPKERHWIALAQLSSIK